MTRLVDTVYEACGHVLGVTPNASAIHESCPRRQIGRRAPKYVTQTVDEPARAVRAEVAGSGTARADHGLRPGTT